MSDRRCDGILRRDLLRVGGLTAFGLGLGDLFRLQRQAMGANVTAAKAKSCILIWLDGGPSHLETFDPKVDAPSEVRGPFGTIQTRVPGIHLSELMEQTASHMEDVAVVRSMTSPLGEHNFGTHYLMTGYKPTPVLEYPTVGATFSHLRSAPGVQVLPANVAVPRFNVGGSKLSGNGFLSSAFRPFSVGGDPAKRDFEVKDLNFYKGLDLERLERRKGYVGALNSLSEVTGASFGEQSDPDLERAYRLLASDEAKAAFDLEQESAEVRARYGPKTVGQSCLLARRLVERGVSFVTVNHRGWDTHEDLVTRLKNGYVGAKTPIGLIPSLDRAFGALLSDLKESGMLDETLVMVMGEFGRTPKLNTRGGRDHWPRVFSVAMAGGGVAGGQVYGSSDRVGESPKDNPVTPSDLTATVYQLLGIDPATELQTNDGRPVRVAPPEAKVIEELIA